MDSVYSQYAWLIPVFPLLAFCVLTAVGRQFSRFGPWLGVSFTLISLVLSILVLAEHAGGGAEDYSRSIDWIYTGSVRLTIGFEINHLNALMLVIVSLVSFLVNLYSREYMKRDERINVFYGYVALFTFSMLALVLSENLLQLYIFWELVGVCSFLLIGFWYEKQEAKAAARKAFIVTRIGDVGLLAAILLLYWHMPNHALDFTSIQNAFVSTDPMIAAGVTTAIALLIFVGAVGKSGQFPLHTWLPDAMEGPTPISALIHAATMVAAGVYLVVRTYDVFLASDTAMTVVAVVGGFTALFAATIALAQNDIKRVLAYSTVSQLGYMMMALGIGAAGAGMFHLFTHAFFKALLFLGAGSVIHAIHRQNILEMGGIGRSMRTTAWTFAIGGLALSGIPPFSGFWSKDMILAAAYDGHPILFTVGLLTAFLTALYMARLFFLVFAGKPRSQMEARESPAVMTIPLIILAALSILSGFVDTPFSSRLVPWLAIGESGTHDSAVVMMVSAAAGLLGIYIGWLFFGKGTLSSASFAERWSGLRTLLERKYYMDELYQRIIVIPLRGLGLGLQQFDRKIVDGAVQLVNGTALGIGRWSLRLQNGQIQTYGLVTLLGFIVLVLALVGRRFW